MNKENWSPVVIIALTEVFDKTVPSKIIFLFPYLKTDGTSLLILFLAKNFEEKEIQFLKEWFCQKLCQMTNVYVYMYIFLAPRHFQQPIKFGHDTPAEAQ